MFVALLVVTFFVALAVTFIVTRMFNQPIKNILRRTFVEDVSDVWHRYVVFAIYVVGVSGGVRVLEMEKYISPRGQEPPPALTSDRWVLEVYRTIIDTLQNAAVLLLLFFMVALVAYAISRASGKREGNHTQGAE